MFYLFIWQTGKEKREWERGGRSLEGTHAPIHWFTPPMPVTPGAGWGQSQELATESRSPMGGWIPITWAITAVSQDLYWQEVGVRSWSQVPNISIPIWDTGVSTGSLSHKPNACPGMEALSLPPFFWLNLWIKIPRHRRPIKKSQIAQKSWCSRS